MAALGRLHLRPRLRGAGPKFRLCCRFIYPAHHQGVCQRLIPADCLIRVFLGSLRLLSEILWIKFVVLESIRQMQTDLENDLQLQYNNYNTLSAQVLAYKAKVQEATPAFTTLQRATVPLGPAGPKRPQIIFVCLFLAALFTTIYVLYKEHQLKPMLGLS